MVRFNEIKKFHAENGHFNIPQSKYTALYHWRRNQKHAKDKNKLLKYRNDLLESIGFFRDDSVEQTLAQAPIIDITSDKTLMDRIRELEEGVGVSLENKSLCEKVSRLEIEIFGDVGKETLIERVCSLEKQLL